jgi:antitoxin (DNA-binding transcriptional repressor) of toxin-antitoxin stability system
MPATITLEKAGASVKQSISKVLPGEEFIIKENQRLLAKLVGQGPRSPRTAPGLVKGWIPHMAPGFDDPLEIRGAPGMKLLRDADTLVWLVDRGQRRSSGNGL